MTTTDDPDVFQSRWNSHINELEHLKMSLPPERFEDLDECQETLRELVEEATVTIGDGDD